MGQSLTYHCPHCEYEFDYSLHPESYPLAFIAGMQEARDGKLGARLKGLLEEHPEGVIDFSKVLYQCEKCGRYTARERLDFYVPKGRELPGTMVPHEGDGDLGREFLYVLPEDLQKYYELSHSFAHVCGHCHGHLKELPEGLPYDQDVKCPLCGEVMEILGIIDGD